MQAAQVGKDEGNGYRGMCAVWMLPGAVKLDDVDSSSQACGTARLPRSGLVSRGVDDSS